MIQSFTSGSPATTLDADFFNTWNQKALERIVTDCRNGVPRCGRH